MQDLDKFKNEMNLSGQNVYVGHRYVPKIFGEWNNTKSYEALSIVQYQGDSFTSRQIVPVGIDINNEEFWVSTGNYNAQVEQYRQDVVGVQTDIKTLKTNTENNIQTLETNVSAAFDTLAMIINPSMTVSEIQEVLNQGGYIKFTSGLYQVDLPNTAENSVFKIKSNTTLLFDKDAKIELLAHNASDYRVLDLENVENVTIINPTIDARKDLNAATTGEWGMGISIKGTQNVQINNAKVFNCWGDGIYIGSSSTRNFSENTYLENVLCDGCRRQGISVISVKGLYGKNVRLINTLGTSPEAGIDFEPNYATDFLQDIHFEDLQANNNNGSGIIFALDNLTENYEKINMTFDSVSIVGNGGDGIAFRKFNGSSNGSIVFNQPFVKNTKQSSISVINVKSTFSKIVLIQPTIVNNNISQTGGIISGSGISVSRTSDYGLEDANFKIGNIEIDTPTFITESDYVKYGNDISFSDNANTTLNFIEKIILHGISTESVNNGLLLPDASIYQNKVFKYNYWEGASPVNLSFPISSSFNSLIEFTNTKNCNAQLRNDTPNFAQPLTFSLMEDSTYTCQILPPEGEKIYPTQYSKGLKTTGGLNGGSSCTLKRTEGKWVVTNIVGKWEAIV